MRVTPAWVVFGLLVVIAFAYVGSVDSPVAGPWLLVSSIFGLIGAAIGQKARGRAVAGYICGFLFWFLGWLLVLLFADQRRRCPECRGVVPDDAIRCMHCTRPIRVTATESGN